HGSDARLLLRAPRRARQHVVSALLSDGARFRFVSQQLRIELTQSLAPAVAARLASASRLGLPTLDLTNPPARQAQSADLGVSHDEELWIVAGRLIANKRVDRAIDEARRRGATLIVLGDGPERGALERRALANGTRTRFLGQVRREEALGIIACADRLVHLSE